MQPPPYTKINICNETTSLLNMHNTSNINSAPYICMKCNDCCDCVYNNCNNCCGYYNKFYNFYNKWITFKTVGFTLLFLAYIAFPISEIIYGQVFPTKMFCVDGTPINDYKLHSLDIFLWLLIDSICLIVILLFALLFSYISYNEWKLDSIINTCIFLLSILFVFNFVWTIIGTIILAKTFSPCRILNDNGTASVTLVRILFGGIFYIFSLIMLIIGCRVT